jgi:formate hydrogenlyase subunit 3/multisubunit Na+/H+ antiporter MnhD subunit
MVLSLVGFITVLVGGVWASFQQHLGRVMGYAVIVDIGLTLMAVSVRESEALRLYFGLFPPRMAALLLWSVALTLVRRTRRGLTLDKIGGLVRESPFVVAGLLGGQLTLAGLPLLPGFPVRLALFSNLAAQNLWLAAGTTVGTWGLLVAGTRTIQALLQPAEDDSRPREANRLQDGFFVVGIVVLVLFGIFPGLVSPAIEALAQAFVNFGR